ncbi:MAG: hypothetical protein U5J98_03525 [Halobacteriales archaeon]|nr:hypothetical protein [Halobacteriales archaeon]
MAADRIDADMLPRAAALVGVSTAIVTAAFVGVVALATGQATKLTGRLPFYVLVMAVVFTAFVFLIDSRASDGGTVIISSIGVAVLGFLLVLLAGEGLLFLVTKPDQLLASQLIVYLVSAGLVCTGLAYWGLRHWREFVT